MDIQETIDLSNFAFENGADTVIIVGPYYYGLSDDSILTGFQKWQAK
ncbi:hypothetical protein FACS1894179_09860 [Bacteroidia bacterium]|nr:hypothetical protein FACS1894179_09860 [Bacteroidia bacterium]